ncbi:MAG: type I methionyl aminopeptidase [Candidatus Bipolaricaulis sp.]|nr:type I methionyl aminopeptidase [Candidatus Bipolaricaulis sp.]MDD5220355.1 type I methionyl aminopeptidase [Candidatus Bipolaricaulis sp.]MDD5646614.1 type I methionyl aminopeptidase [Candidatus Bipolaricaulis sp.]
MIPLKSPEELAVMRENGALLAGILERLCEDVRPGRTTAYFDRLARSLIAECGGETAFDRLAGFPGAINASLNEEIVHGIPSDDRVLAEGDVFSVDIGMVRRGFCVDMATTVGVGRIGAEAQRLLEVGEESLWEGIRNVRIGNRVSDVSHAIGSFVEAKGYFVVREYVGHGIGRNLHEDPQIPNYGPAGHGPRLRAGMTLAIEPMVKTDPLPTEVRDDRWTVATASGGLSVHFEHTVALTGQGVVVLTQGGDARRSVDE